MLKIKNKTQHSILKYIWLKDTFTRQELSEKLNVDRSTISRNLEVLMKQNLVLKNGETSSSKKGGRKTNLLSLNKNSFYIIGISITGKEVYSILTNIKGEIIDSFSISGHINNRNIDKNIYKIIDQYLNNYENIVGICLAMPGIVDSQKGIIILSDELNLKNYSLKSILEEKYNIFVYIENDANAGAAAYLLHSKLKISNLIYFIFFFPNNLINLEGLGAGIIINKKLYNGSNSAAGEIKFNKYELNFSITLDDIKNYENSKKKELVDSFLNIISEKIVQMSSFLDPEKIILGGDITLFSKKMKNYFISNICSKLNKKNKFIVIDTGEIKTVAVGTVTAFLNEVMNNFEFISKIQN
ncbi:ArsR family transcriptional regulator [Tepiditoga spiralis]|uniref:ArsR family transcriptional regulator n=1 Tax=Tepiditoga spiralis TaxID=2108365 RepID=A0A7G1G683_9BACT|nr:ROK family transcriptional regulator [Tepiditoga spiralis]BBE31675.1 ArsR family transcriptional regulator [Tepiditoga spiralis]